MYAYQNQAGPARSTVAACIYSIVVVRFHTCSIKPISLLVMSTVSKVRLVLARLRPHLTNSANFSKRQSAYRQGHSTETALVDVLESVFTAADNKEITVLIISTCNYK